MFASFRGARSFAIAREPIAWAFLSAVGAGLLVGVVVELLVLAVYPVLFPPTREQVVVVPARALWETTAAVAAGVVAMRAGGVRAAAVYVLFELLLVGSQLPARAFSCSRTRGFEFPPGFASPCDYATLVTGRWYFWVALAVGIVVARAVRDREGTNMLLRAAGILGVASAVAPSLALAVVYAFYAPTVQGGPGVFVQGPNGFFVGVPDLPLYAVAVGEVVGGAFAGALLARRGPAAPVLIALALVAPSFAFGVPQWRNQTGMPPFEPLGLLVARFSWLWTPLLGSLAVFAAWAVAGRTGTHRLAPQ